MAKPRGLGRGFDALIPTEVPPDLPADIAPSSGDLVRQVDPAAIAPNPHQPRHHFDDADLKGLADSIHQYGLLQPLVVSDRGNGRYELVAGERRLRAAKLLGLTQVPVIVRSFDEQQKLELALLENLQRAQLNPIETAAAYHKLITEFNLSLDEVSRRMGKAKSTIANVLRLLQLPPPAQKVVATGAISEAHGRAILALSDPMAQEELLQHIVTEGWTVRQAEAFARAHKAVASGPDAKGRLARRASHASAVPSDLAQTLGAYLGTRVTLQPTARGGKLIIEYQGDEQLQRIMTAIKPSPALPPDSPQTR